MMAGTLATGTRCVALVGPYLSGKTTLMEALLFATGAIPRKGSVKDGNSVGDSSPEARARQMSTEVSIGYTEFLGDDWAFVDCPGSVELTQESFNALHAADVAVIVCEPAVERAVALAPLFRFLQDKKIPHMVFINKMDTATQSVQTVLEALQGGSSWPLVLRHLPITEGEDITGYVDLVAFGRMDGASTGDVLTPFGELPAGMAAWHTALTPVYSFAIEAENRADEVKLTGSLQRLNEEDPSLTYRQDNDVHQLLLEGQGEIHLRLAIERLKSKYNVAAATTKPKVPYKESIQKAVSQHARFKRQTGGHGMFGDVHLDIKPRPRGAGFEFADTVVGGSVPKQYIPAVEAGAREFMDQGALGFPVVDVAVTLTDGQFHAVDSNEMSFKLAAREAMKEGLPKCAPVLLEPIVKVDVDVPSEFTNKVHGLISARRGQIQGFDAKEGWTGWDMVSALMPQSEIQDLIIELRSLTQGVASYHAEFDHLQELTGRLATQVVEEHKTEAAEAS